MEFQRRFVDWLWKTYLCSLYSHKWEKKVRKCRYLLLSPVVHVHVEVLIEIQHVRVLQVLAMQNNWLMRSSARRVLVFAEGRWRYCREIEMNCLTFLDKRDGVTRSITSSLSSSAYHDDVHVLRLPLGKTSSYLDKYLKSYSVLKNWSFLLVIVEYIVWHRIWYCDQSYDQN